MRRAKTRSPLLVTVTASLLAGAAALFGCTSILGGFDSARETGRDGATDDTGATSPDGGGDDDGGPDGGATSDGGGDAPILLTCDAPEVACGVGASAVCANRDTSGAHCGACGHSCGGGVCTQGKCGPAKVFSGTPVGAIALDVDEVLFASNDTSDRLLACPKSGCTAAPRQVAVMPFGIGAVDVPSPGTVAFISAPQNSSGTERPAIFSCPSAACPALPTSFVSDGLNGFDSRLRSLDGTLYAYSGGSGLIWSTCDAGACASPAKGFGTLTKGTHGFYPGPGSLFFIDSSTRGSPIAKCAAGDTACTPTAVLAGDQSALQAVVVFASKLFWLLPGRDGFVEGKLMSCDLPACASPAAQAGGLDSPLGLIVDAGGSFWLTKTGKIQRCAPNGCPGGQQDVAGPIAGVHDLVADDAFIYWGDATTITRLAK